MEAIQDIFEIFGSLSEMAVALDLPYQTVAKWKQRGRIPSESWGAVIEAAKARGRKFTFEQLAEMNPPRQSAGVA